MTALDALEKAQQIPKAAYRLNVELQANSFVATHQEQMSYYFYRKSQIDWLEQIKTHHISTEADAKDLFDKQYNLAIKSFNASILGQKIIKIYPHSQWQLSDYSTTWQHFLNGTYGLCTRTGLPNEIFLKHIYIRFIEFITQANRPSEIKPNMRHILAQAVNALDVVEADFAPHEVAQSSRQRCIINVRNEYLS